MSFQAVARFEHDERRFWAADAPTDMDHERFEMALDKRLRGELSADDDAALDAHLRDCAACRRFEASVGATAMAMSARVSQLERAIDWNRVQTHVSKARRSARFDLLAYGALISLMVTGAILVAYAADLVLAGIVIVPTLVITGLAALAYRRLRKATDADPIAFVRDDLRLNIRRNREYQALAVLYAWANSSVGALVMLAAIVATLEWHVHVTRQALERLG